MQRLNFVYVNEALASSYMDETQCDVYESKTEEQFKNKQHIY